MNQNESPKNISAIFDTNIYRELTYGLSESEARALFEKIKKAEASAGVMPALSVVTVMELLAHLADENDPAFQACKVAAVAAGFHGLKSNNEVSYFPHPQLQLQQLIYEDYDEKMMSQFEIVMEIINFLNNGPAEHYIRQFHEQLKEVGSMVRQHKEDFKTTVFSVLNGMDPETTNWNAFRNDPVKRDRTLAYLRKNEEEVLDLMALGYVKKTIQARKEPLSREDTAFAVIDVVTYFRAALMLHLAILKRIIIGGFDMDNRKAKRANTIWDIYQLFCISDAQIGGKDVLFVTGETWLHEIANESGLGAKITRKNDYLRMIGIAL